MDGADAIKLAGIPGTRALLMDAYGACAETAETMGAKDVADELRKLAFKIEGKPGGSLSTVWTLLKLGKAVPK